MDENNIIAFQTYARRHLVRRNYRKTIKKCVVERLEILLDTTKRILPPRTETLRLGNLLMEDYNYEHDGHLLVIVCRLILATMDAPKEQNFSYLLLNKSTIMETHSLVNLIISKIPHLMQSFSGSKVSEIKMWQNLIHFLVVFNSAKGWSVVKSAPQVLPVLNDLCQKMIAPIYTDSNYAKLVSALFVACCGEKPVIGETALNAFFGLIFKECKGERQDELCSVFMVKILTCPALVYYLNKMNKDAIVASKIFGKGLTFLRGRADLFERIEPHRLMYLMSNVIQLGYLDEEGTKEKIADWTWVLGMTMIQCTEFAVKPGERSSHNHWHPIFGNYRLPIDSKAEGALKNVVEQLRLLWSRKVVTSLFDMCLSGISPVKAIGKDAPKDVAVQFGRLWRRLGGGHHEVEPKEEPPSLTAIVCKVYVSALASMYHLKQEIISGICHNDTLLRRLWSYLVMWGQSFTSQDPPPLAGALRLVYHLDSPHAAPLHLFAEAASTMFQILDEEEMYEKGIPFSVEELLAIAKFCNLFCFRVIWDRLLNIENPQGTLFGSIHTLTLLLYSRDCRRAFTPSSKFWLSPDVKSPVLIHEYQRRTERGLLIMEKLSHCISLRDRMLLFRKFVNDEKATIDSAPSMITVVRNRLIEDGYQHLSGWTPAKLKTTIRVKFVNQQGLEEAGIDQDGVFKEFLELTLKQVFAPTLNLFTCTSAGVLYPSPTSFIHENHLALFQYVGRLLAKAIYEGIVVDVQLAPVLHSAVLGMSRNYFWAIDELAQLDHELYKNLTFVKRYEGDVADLALTFSIDNDYLGKVVTTDLMPGGRAVPVTNENKIDYIHKMACYRVFIQTREQCKAFVLGIKSVLKGQWLSLFAPHELQYLISGHATDIDVTDLKKNVQYFGGFHGSHRVIKWLWHIVEHEFSTEERKLFLKFVTSCSKPPLLGFAYLEPPFAIRCVETSDDQDQGDTLGSVLRGFLTLRKNQSASRLPTASTCFNLLKLPNYNKKSILLQKLRYAIHAESGFELS